MDTFLTIPQTSTRQRWVPFLIGLSLFTLPLSATAKTISLSLAIVAILITHVSRAELITLWEKGWCKASVILFALAVLACLWSPASYAERLLVVKKYSILLCLPILVLGFRDEKTRVIGFNAFFAAMFLTSTLAILISNGLLTLLNRDSDNIFLNHIFVGYMLDFAAYTAALFAYRQRGLKRVGYGLLFIMFSYHVLFINEGRMGYIVYFLSMFLLILQLFSWRQAALAITVLCVSFVLAYSQSPLMKERIHLLHSQYENYRHQNGDNSVGFRMQFHAFAHELFNRHPIKGNGTSSFLYYFKMENPVPGWGPILLQPHSQYWSVASEFGLAGIAALLAFFLTLLKASWKLGAMRPIALGMLLPFMVANLSDSLLLFSASSYFFILFMALCLSEEDLRSSKRQSI
ncbi:MAG: O-antigen ligase family protein [Tatlockia sp.]|nr:O-antigen ligase family protein [Tatlockia sp.]